MSAIHLTIGERLRGLRFINHKTQKQIAKELNCTRFQISHFETDKMIPKYEKIRIYMRIFNVSSDFILWGFTCSVHISLIIENEICRLGIVR